MKHNKKPIIILTLILGYIIWSQTYSYDINKSVSHAEKHRCQKSHSCCAWYVMRAMQSGGCPMIILPAWAYRDALPFYGYQEVASGMGNQMNGFHPQKGDVVVIENGKHSIWGARCDLYRKLLDSRFQTKDNESLSKACTLQDF